MRDVEAQLEGLFPTPGLDPDTAVSTRPGADLPRIPGYDVEALLGRRGMGVVERSEPIASRLSGTLARHELGPSTRYRYGDHRCNLPPGDSAAWM